MSENLPDPTYPFADDTRDAAAVAYVIIPAGHDPAAYVRQVLDTGRMSVVTDRGEFIHRVLVARHVLRELNQAGWPQLPGERGPAVMLATLPVHNTPVAVATLLGADEVSGMGAPGEDGLLLRGPGNTFVALRARADAGSLAITLNGDGAGQSQLTLRLLHPDSHAQHDSYVQGDTRHRSEGSSQLEAGQKLTLRVGPSGSSDDAQGQMLLTYERGQGLTYTDEWGNELRMAKDLFSVRRQGEHQQIALTAAGVNLGSQDAAEPVLLGKTTLELVGQLIDLILQAQFNSNAGPTFPLPLNSGDFLKLKLDFQKALSQYVKVD